MWKSIKLASDKVDIFDFEGTMVESVERFFRGFVEFKPLLPVSESIWKWLRSIFKLMILIFPFLNETTKFI